MSAISDLLTQINEKLSLFQSPVVSNTGINDQEKLYKLEKYKLLSDVFKWLSIGVASTFVGVYFSNILDNRKQDLEEMKFFQIHSEIITNNTEPYKRRYLAQFYSCVNVNEYHRTNWYNYYNSILKEYKADSLRMTIELVELNNKLTELKKSNVDLSLVDSISNEIKSRENIQKGIFEIKIPNNLPAFDFESRGFQELLNRNIKTALDAFNKAYELYPTLHNVDEIRKLLILKQSVLNESTSEEWINVYEIIIDKYSWKIPQNVVEGMKDYMKSKK